MRIGIEIHSKLLQSSTLAVVTMLCMIPVDALACGGCF